MRLCGNGAQDRCSRKGVGRGCRCEREPVVSDGARTRTTVGGQRTARRGPSWCGMAGRLCGRLGRAVPPSSVAGWRVHTFRSWVTCVCGCTSGLPFHTCVTGESLMRPIPATRGDSVRPSIAPNDFPSAPVIDFDIQNRGHGISAAKRSGPRSGSPRERYSGSGRRGCPGSARRHGGIVMFALSRWAGVPPGFVTFLFPGIKAR